MREDLTVIRPAQLRLHRSHAGDSVYSSEVQQPPPLGGGRHDLNFARYDRGRPFCVDLRIRCCTQHGQRVTGASPERRCCRAHMGTGTRWPMQSARSGCSECLGGSPPWIRTGMLRCLGRPHKVAGAVRRHSRQLSVVPGRLKHQQAPCMVKAPDRSTWSGAIHLRWVWDLNPR